MIPNPGSAWEPLFSAMKFPDNENSHRRRTRRFGGGLSNRSTWWEGMFGNLKSSDIAASNPGTKLSGVRSNQRSICRTPSLSSVALVTQVCRGGAAQPAGGRRPGAPAHLADGLLPVKPARLAPCINRCIKRSQVVVGKSKGDVLGYSHFIVS